MDSCFSMLTEKHSACLGQCSDGEVKPGTIKVKRPQFTLQHFKLLS